MRGFFYNNIFHRVKQDIILSALSIFSGGALLGCLICVFSDHAELRALSIGLLLDQPGLAEQICSGLCPLLLSAALSYLIPGHWAMFLSSGLSGFLFSFSITVLASGLSQAGWLAAALLLAGRGAALLFLFWFLLRRVSFGRRRLGIDLLIACCFSAACLAFFSWLLTPALEELCLFILT